MCSISLTVRFVIEMIHSECLRQHWLNVSRSSKSSIYDQIAIENLVLSRTTKTMEFTILSLQVHWIDSHGTGGL